MHSSHNRLLRSKFPFLCSPTNWFSSKLRSERGSSDCHLLLTPFTLYSSHSSLFPPTLSQMHLLKVNFTSALFCYSLTDYPLVLCATCVYWAHRGIISHQKIDPLSEGGWVDAGGCRAWCDGDEGPKGWWPVITQRAAWLPVIPSRTLHLISCKGTKMCFNPNRYSLMIRLWSLGKWAHKKLCGLQHEELMPDQCCHDIYFTC